MSTTNLKDLFLDTKSTHVAFPSHDTFVVEVAHISRPELLKIRKSCVYHKFSRGSNSQVEMFDEEKFIAKFAAATIKGWKGLTVKILDTLALVNSNGLQPDMEIPYTEANAVELLSNSMEFDAWINEVVFDLEKFRTFPKEPSTRESE